jgi:TolA-binding protein
MLTLMFRKRFFLTGLMGIAAFQLGCTSLKHQTQLETENERLRGVERELRRKLAEVQDLKERNLVLERRLIQQGHRQTGSTVTVPVPFEPSAAQARFVPEVQPPEPEVIAVVPNGEQRFYAKILDCYRANKMTELEKTLDIFLKTFPDSALADNALFIAGQLAFEQKNEARAISYLDRLLAKFPSGNKAVSALLAKALIEGRRARHGEARRLLEKIRTAYPGSPESTRAAFEIKLIDSKGSERREM